MEYYINYHTGSGNETAADLDEAKRIADENAAYTQEAITIHDETGDEVARRNWWGVKYDPENDPDTEDPICFGDYGYYGDWTEM